MDSKHQLRLLVVDNFQIRRYGAGREGQGYRFMCGGVRNNYRVMSFSERDITRYLAPLGFLRNIGAKMMNKRFIKTCLNFRPDLVLIGHCDYLRNSTLEKIHSLLPQVKLVHINVDPIWQEHTVNQIRERMYSCDAIFITTAGEKLQEWTTGKNIVGFLPNMCDETMEWENVSPREDFKYDLFFAGHDGSGDERISLVRELDKNLSNKIRFGLFGTCGRPAISGSDYEEALLSSSMSLSLNRREGWKWYSSDRLAHLMGRGIFTFISNKSGYQEFFKDGEEAVFFDGPKDLAEKVLYYAANPEKRRKIASAGRKRYHLLFNSARVLRYIVDTVYETDNAKEYEWSNEVYKTKNS
ncbi:MAG: glycosyltransferase family 1 protein [Kiritimatiellae bacterium]|nr:glycosyltransferase family 1 protein [Kiritimatiellia bacterium]